MSVFLSPELERRVYTESIDTNWAAQEAYREMARPVYLLRPILNIDGNQYFFLYGKNIMEGVAGFGPTPEAAALDFDHNWKNLTIGPAKAAK